MRLSNEIYDVYDVPIHQIYADTQFNCRDEFENDSVAELSETIESDGLLFPVVIQPAEEAPNVPDGFKFRLICGYRRYTACKYFLKWDTIPANIRTGLTERQAKLLNFRENLDRKDLNIWEESKNLDKLFPVYRTNTSIAEELKRPTEWVRVRRTLMTLSEFIQKAAASGRIGYTDLRKIIAHPDPDELAKELLASSEYGHKTRVLYNHRRPKKKSDVQSKMADLLKDGIHPNILRLMGWCIGEVTEENLEESIEWLRQRRAWLR